MSAEITQLLQRARKGDREALNLLVPIVYRELHRVGELQLRRDRPNHTLQPTALVNEAFLRIFGDSSPSFTNRSHFFGVAAHVMRQVLVDHARARNAKKRGCALQVPLADQDRGAEAPLADILAVDEALERLRSENEHLAKLVEMRFFAGMTAEEIADVLSESVHAVRHDLRYAQAWLRKELDTPQKRLK